MSAHALRPSEKPAVIVARNLDLVVLAIALPIFLAAGLPIGGWLVAAGIWAMWRGIGTYSERKAAAASSPREVVGITGASMVGRGWLLGLSLLGAGLAFGDDVGLSAAVLAIVLFTLSFTAKLIFRPLDGPGATTT